MMATMARAHSISPRNAVLRHKGIATILPKIRAQSAPDYVPDSKVYKVEAILRPWRIPKFLRQIHSFPVMRPLLCKRFYNKIMRTHVETSEHRPISTNQVLLKMGIHSVTVSDARGFGAQGGSKERQGVIPVADVIRVRTGERGQVAERMTGGRADKSSAV